MPKPKPDPTREQRIIDEIVVDAYGEEERAMSWYCHLEEKLEFPFKARCVAPRTISPLKKGEKVAVIAMAQEAACNGCHGAGKRESCEPSTDTRGRGWVVLIDMPVDVRCAWSSVVLAVREPGCARSGPSTISL